MSFLFVALGGALGAVARYAISLIPVKTGFPVLTLITNIIGARTYLFCEKIRRLAVERLPLIMYHIKETYIDISKEADYGNL